MTPSSLAEAPSKAAGRSAARQDRTEFVEEPRGAFARAGALGLRALRAAAHGIARAWRAFAGIVTPAGWLVVLWSVLGLALGLVLGWGEFLIGAAIGLIMLALATPFLVGKEAYDVEFALEHDAVVAGQEAFGDIVVRSPRARFVLPGRIDIPVGTGLVDFHVPLLRRGHDHRERIVIPARRRGVLEVGPATTTRTDPLHLLRREFRWADVSTLYIHPVTIAVPSTSMGFIRDLEGSSTRIVTSEDISFHAVREYATGDALRHIHWKSTAKVGDLMVRQFEETRRSTISLILDRDDSSYADPDEFEMAVSVVGSFGVRALRDGRDVRAVASGDIPEFAAASVRAMRQLKVSTPRALLDELSGVESGASVAHLPALARLLCDLHPDTSLAMIVTGSEAPLARLQSAALAFPANVGVATIVCDPSAEPSIKAMGRTRVLTIGLLGDLRQLLAKSARV